MVSISSTVSEELVDFNKAHAPVTCGAAIEVPPLVPNVSPGTDDSILTPGARRSRKLAAFEKPATASAFVVAPTLITLEIHAGEIKAVALPSFPDAAMVAIPTERNEAEIEDGRACIQDAFSERAQVIREGEVTNQLTGLCVMEQRI